MLAAFVAVSMSLLAAIPPTTENCTPLQVSVVRGELENVQRLAGRRLLGLGAPAVALDERGGVGPCFRRTALMLAAEHGQLASAQVLISSGASLEATALLPELGDEAVDARCLAIANARAPLVAALDKAGAKDQPCMENARFFAAIEGNAIDGVERQLRTHPSKETLEAGLLARVGRRTGKILDVLVQAGLERKLDFKDVYDAAIEAGDTDMVNQLSSGGAKVHGGQALSRAIALRHAGAVASLLAAGARTDTAEAREAILEAVRARDFATVRALLGAGYRGDPEIPLLLQAVRHAPSLVSEMVKAGVGIEIDDASGTTPLMAAAENQSGLVRLLIERGASARTADIACNTAFDPAHTPGSHDDELLQKPNNMPRASVLPGRAARRMGITCGAARLSITFDPDFEVYLATAQVPMASAKEYRVDPGIHTLRVKQRSTGAERRMTVTLSQGLNSYSETFFDFAGKQPSERHGNITRARVH